MTLRRLDAEFEAFVVAASPRLLALAFRLTGDHQHAEDLLQSCLWRVARRWSAARDNPTAYARRVMANLAKDGWRRRGRRFVEVTTDDPGAYRGSHPVEQDSGLEDSQLAALPEPDLQVPDDLLPNLRRRQARRRVLAPAAVVSVVVAVVVAVPLGLAHRSGSHPANPAQPGGPVTMTLTLRSLNGAALEPGARASVLGVLQARMRAAHAAGTAQTGDAPVTLRVTGLDHPLPAALLSVGALSLRQVYAVTGGDTNPAVPPGATTSEVAPSECAKLSKVGTTETPSAYAVCRYEAVRCSTYQPTVADQIADNWSVSCSRDKNAKYLLFPATVNSGDVRDASATMPVTPVGTGQWLVDVAFTPTGQRRFTDLTRAAIVATAPQNQVAIVVDGVVQSAPVIQDVIPGDASISGDYDQTQAEQLAAVLTGGALPARLEVTAVSGR